jgi:uncharacterized membrane protein YedE/YeeE
VSATATPRAANEPRIAAVAFGAGLLFGIGLGISGMTAPSKVLAFLDVASPAWDPSLAFVMAGAIGVHFLFARYALRASQAGRAPLVAPRYALPEKTKIDRPLLIGALVFGIGWGLGGFCPGPGIVGFVVTPAAVVFVGALLVGIFLTRQFQKTLARF